MRTFILSSGAALYVGLVGLVLATHSVNNTRSVGDPRLTFVADGQRQTVVRVEHGLGAITVSRR